MAASLVYRGAQRVALQPNRDAQDDVRDDGVVGLVRMAQFLVALPQGEHAAQTEEHECDHEGPEIALSSGSERMGARLADLGSAGAEHEQALIPGIGQ